MATMMHHAILLRDHELRTKQVETLENEFVQDSYFEKFQIDDVRALTASAYRRPPAGKSGLCFIVRTPFVTVEAQHALLKLLEEPPATSRFIFVTHPALSLLPTVLSRFQTESPDRIDKVTVEFSEFESLALKNRLEVIEEKLKQKDNEWIENVKTGLISFLNTESIDVPTTLVDLEFVAGHLLTRGASNKMLLEQLALTLPLK